jgi:hypothetical protein
MVGETAPQTTGETGEASVAEVFSQGKDFARLLTRTD